MKNIKIILFLGLFACVGCSTSQPLVMGTYNVRIRTPKDSLAGPWEQRCPFVARNIQTIGYDIVGIQELLDTFQSAELQIAAGMEYELLCQGRESNVEQKGEALGILYKKARIEIVHHGHFHVSPTPDSVSVGWDAHKYRICLWAECRDKQEKSNFYFFVTHLDHKGVAARNCGAALVAQKAKEIAGNVPYVLVGDMNSSLVKFPEVYKAYTASMRDAREVSKQTPQGPYATYSSRFVNLSNGFQDVPEHRLDYIFVSKGNVLFYQTVTEDFGQNILPSDHLPLVIKYKIK